jgi:ATP-binding cassette, subfamily B, bacterial
MLKTKNLGTHSSSNHNRVKSVSYRLWRRRLAPIMQSSPTECGAACLVMLLNHYGYNLTLADFRQHFGTTGRDGLGAKDLVQIARDFGLGVRAFSLAESDLSDVPLPAIVHWQFNHYLMVERQDAKHTIVLDPAYGRRKLTRQEFDSGFTGVALFFDNPAATSHSKAERVKPLDNVSYQPRNSENKRKKSFQWQLVEGLRQEKGLLGGLVLAGLLLQAAAFLPALLLKRWLEGLLPASPQLATTGVINLPNQFWFIAAGIVTGLGFFSLYLLRAGLLAYLSARLAKKLGENVRDKLLAQPYPFFGQWGAADVVNRLQSGRIIREIFTGQLLTVGLDAFLLIGFLIIVYSQSLSLGLTVTIVGGLQLLVNIATRSRLTKLTQTELNSRNRLEAFQSQTLSGILDFKIGGTTVERSVTQKWVGLEDSTIAATLQRSVLRSWLEAFSTALRLSTPVAVLAIGSLQTNLSPGTLLALNTLSLLALVPLASLSVAFKGFGELKLHCQRLAELCDDALPTGSTNNQADRKKQELTLTGKIEFRNVSFRHNPYSPFVLNDVSFVIEPGQKVAIVGASGSGKSTLAKLLLGLYQPTEGTIYYDDQPLGSYDLGLLQEQIGAVLQESSLWATSLRENVAFYRADISLTKIAEALETAGLTELVRQLPLGYETKVGDGGSNLSGGQRQRLLIARALVCRPRVLILDEATSQLDAPTKAALLTRLAQLPCTQILIAHRLSAVESADRVIVLDERRIVQAGKPAELLAQNGHYRRLYISQTSKL